MNANMISVYGSVVKVTNTKRMVSNSETSCTNVTIMVRNKYTSKCKTTFFTFTGWGECADKYARTLSKGYDICVSGALQPRTYVNKNGEVAVDLRILGPEVLVMNSAIAIDEANDN